ncbi:MAG TPA: uroporphyrinogen decarboxylase family protein [Candidatus Brocadiia bacterium]|nr:uroporphyrinogen decarboxylase family protein [Candidatus Brocadiia bacterium]
MGQNYTFGIADTAVARYGGVTLDDLYWNTGAILKAFDATAQAAERIGSPPPKPRLAGFSYGHVSALGCEIAFPGDSEPKPLPRIRTPSDIDNLRAPRDYFAVGTNPRRLRVRDELNRLRPGLNAGACLGVEGPVTTAALLMGQDFFILPYEDPARAKKLLEFSARSAVEFIRAAYELETGKAWKAGAAGICDDFAGMFPPAMFDEFVLPYWEIYYDGLEATRRHLHSELLREAHLSRLKQLRIEAFDPSADQFLDPPSLARSCPCPFQLRIQSWHMRDMKPAELKTMYERLASYRPYTISFYLTWPQDEGKAAAILEKAKEIAA